MTFFFFFKDPNGVKALIAKAESLYNTCDFEHALMLFIRGKFLASESSIVKNGMSKCSKTIVNKIKDQDIFFFSGSKYFFDHLRNEGDGSVDSYLNGKEKSFQAKATLAAIKRRSFKEKGKAVKTRPNNDRMKEDKAFLKNLEDSIVPLSCLVKDPVRY